MARGASSANSAASIRSTVSWAVLGLVIETPGHGYELAVRFERTYGELVELSGRSHIYSALDSLTRRGLITEHAAPGALAPPQRHPKARYEASTEGIAQHQKWLAGQLIEQRRRSRRFTIQLAALQPEQALEVLEKCEQQTLREGTKPATPRPSDPHDDSPERLAERLSAEDERLTVDSSLAWIEYARTELGADPQPAARRPATDATRRKR